MNLVLLSPHFPPNYYNFAIGAHRAGLKVLGIGDTPDAHLRPELRDVLTEYYRVDDIHNYDSLLRACAYLTFKHGRIDRLESHSEYWLETDARLRADFNIPGLKPPDMEKIKPKSRMKQIFTRAGVEVSSGQVVTTLDAARQLIAEIGYPVVAKPDVGVGASSTHRINNDADLEKFFAEKPPQDYMLEAFVTGQLHSFDGLTDRDGRLVFYTAHFYKPGIMTVVNQDSDICACSYRQIPSGLEVVGKKAVAAFGVHERFFHIEFFQREHDGHWVALEINMRPPGGMMMDVFNYANDIDLYQQWANVVAFNTFTVEYSRPYHCAYLGVKRHHHHKHSHEDVLRECGDLIVHHEPVPLVFSQAMGNYCYLLRSADMDELERAMDFILAS